MAKERTLYLDMDGVMFDFEGAFIKQFGHPPRAYEEKVGTDNYWRDIRTEAPQFYATLPLMPDARMLFDAVAHLNPIFLSGVPQGGWANQQKIDCAARHFPGTRAILCRSRLKYEHCSPGDVIVDDWPKYAHLWRKAGGVFIQHTNAVTSLQLLKNYFEGIK